MLLRGKVRLPFFFFFNAHLFDIFHRTDTHTWLPKELFLERPKNFDDAILYMASWTSEIKRSFFALMSRRLFDKTYVFVDVGCGKGKACLLWKLLDRRYGNSSCRVVGIDFYEPFINIAKANHRLVFPGVEVHDFYQEDAVSFNYVQFRHRLIVYLYNPFNERIIVEVIKRIPINTIIIYNNPVHRTSFATSKFRTIYSHFGWHPNLNTIMFEKIS
jgi:SAM-dependent methyltransferase